jgi:phage shock protein A
LKTGKTIIYDIIIKVFPRSRAVNHVLQQLHFLNLNIKQVMGNQKDDAAKLATILAQLQKATAEIQAKIQALIDAASNADVTPELQTAIDDLTPAAQALDDIVPDGPTA